MHRISVQPTFYFPVWKALTSRFSIGSSLVLRFGVSMGQRGEELQHMVNQQGEEGSPVLWQETTLLTEGNESV